MIGGPPARRSEEQAVDDCGSIRWVRIARKDRRWWNEGPWGAEDEVVRGGEGGEDPMQRLPEILTKSGRRRP